MPLDGKMNLSHCCPFLGYSLRNHSLEKWNYTTRYNCALGQLLIPQNRSGFSCLSRDVVKDIIPKAQLVFAGASKKCPYKG